MIRYLFEVQRRKNYRKYYCKNVGKRFIKSRVSIGGIVYIIGISRFWLVFWEQDICLWMPRMIRFIYKLSVKNIKLFTI
jgi:hypothetical protein